MTRQEAINALMTAWVALDGEFNATCEEDVESAARLREALLALGVTDEEMGG